MSHIKFAVKSVRVDENNRIKRATLINKMESSVDKRNTNEMLYIMAVLSHIQPVGGSKHFTYTFPFNLS
ncbi:hypothetical protein D0T50_09775 [Bacteroides sp. 214]|uniref:hypothetical protein n=1 Tax=Bacteroides sp. 214 TaxID=2302935 RepID=UPI0013D50BE0|nr:hypothetical protein [Bacteroides sp. 214]NDW13182.1 hypothetical protein [Bacteroides sp. 214]